MAPGSSQSPINLHAFYKSVHLESNSAKFGKNLHIVLEKYGNSKFIHLFIQILFFTTDDSSALWSRGKIVEKWS